MSGAIPPLPQEVVLTSELEGNEWSASRSGRFIAGEVATDTPLYRRLGGPQSRSGRGAQEKNSQPPPGIEPPNLG
jgi:hypothetical protein